MENQVAMTDVFQSYSVYYDLLYCDKDYVVEADYVAQTLCAADSTLRDLLEFGSGTGRHGRLLAERGFDVFGVERSESMVTAAHKSPPPPCKAGSGSFECIQGDIRTVKLDRIFDAVVSLFHVVSYQTRNSDVLQTFSNAARHLRLGGLFLFDVWHGPAVLSERPSVRVKRLEDVNTRLTRIAEPELDTNASVVTVRYTMLAESKIDCRLTTFQEEHRMRYFFPVEIGLLAEQTGFSLERNEEFLTGQTPSERTWGVTYLLRKRA
jgi:SAM-dependent methyltransferase